MPPLGDIFVKGNKVGGFVAPLGSGFGGWLSRPAGDIFSAGTQVYRWTQGPGFPAMGAGLFRPARMPAAKPDPRGATEASDLIPLNKYIAHGGICSRRDAAELIRQGKSIA